MADDPTIFLFYAPPHPEPAIVIIKPYTTKEHQDGTRRLQRQNIGIIIANCPIIHDMMEHTI